MRRTNEKKKLFSIGNESTVLFLIFVFNGNLIFLVFLIHRERITNINLNLKIILELQSICLSWLSLYIWRLIHSFSFVDNLRTHSAWAANERFQIPQWSISIGGSSTPFGSSHTFANEETLLKTYYNTANRHYGGINGSNEAQSDTRIDKREM